MKKTLLVSILIFLSLCGCANLPPSIQKITNPLKESLFPKEQNLKQENTQKGSRDQHFNDADAYYDFGKVYLDLGRFEKAISILNIATTLRPSFSKARVQLGTAYYRLGKNEEAIVEFKEAILLNSNEGDAHINLGVVYSKLDKNLEAIWEYQAGIQINPSDANAHYNLGVLYDKIKDGLMAIIHTIKAGLYFKRQDNSKGEAKANKMQRILLEKYQFKREDFSHVSIPGTFF